MLTIQINGISDGERPFSVRAAVTEVGRMFPEFFGDVVVEGKLRKIGNKYIITGAASSDAKLVCDRSNEEFSERITTDISVTFIADTSMYIARQNESDPEQPYYIREDETTINLSDEVRQELAVHLPMKRIAPAYRNADVNELYPNVAFDSETKETDDVIDERWAALKKISFEHKN